MSLHDVLEDAAGVAVAGRSLDPAAILARAERPEYRPVLRPVVGHGAPRWRPRRGLPRHPVARGLLVAASVVVLLVLALAALPGVQRALPQPARTPTSPGVVPKSLVAPPPWTPTLAERPVSRVVYVGSDGRSVPWVVGADGGEYRRLPVGPGVPGFVDRAGGVGSVAVSPDGARVAWTSRSTYGPDARLDVVDVTTGARHGLDLTGSARRGLTVTGLAFSPDGARLAVWGHDRLSGGRAPARLVVLDAARAQPVQDPCTLTDTSEPPAAGWAGDAVVTRGCSVPAADAQGRLLHGRGPDVVPVRTGLPGMLAGEWSAGPFGAPIGSDRPPVVLSADGFTRWSVRATGDAGPDGLVALALEATGDVAGTQPVPLGTLSGAVPLATVPDGVLVSRWSTPNGATSGPSDVALVRPDGRVEVLTTSADERARVAAVAADVVSRARPGGDARVGARVLDGAWWSWQAGRLVGSVPRPDPILWWLAGAFLAATLAARLAVRVSGGRSGARLVGVLGVVAVLVGLALVPTDAPRPPARSGGPVVPAVLADRRLVPPRAFDEVGKPRTTAVALLVDGTVAGRDGAYGTDAATGGLVRLDDLPGADAVRWGRDLAVSPDGHRLTDGHQVVDLRTARWNRFAVGGPEPTLVSEGTRRGAVAIADDGTVALAADDKRLWLYPAGATDPVRVGQVGGVFAVRGAGQGLFVVRLEGAALATEGDPSVLLVDVGSPGSGATPQRPVVTPLTPDQNALVAARPGWRVVSGERGLVLTPGGRALPGADGVDAGWLVDDPTGAAGPGVFVALGSSADADLVVSRTALAGFDTSGDATSEVLTRIDLPSTVRPWAAGAQVVLAAEVVARARPVPPAPEPWWARIPRPA